MRRETSTSCTRSASSEPEATGFQTWPVAAPEGHQAHLPLILISLSGSVACGPAGLCALTHTRLMGRVETGVVADVLAGGRMSGNRRQLRSLEDVPLAGDARDHAHEIVEVERLHHHRVGR